ncbi:hypothetical protein LPJ53_002121 [Coemansia erecta]|uniref:Arrestin-like N-terminal domain-containing protein n=1 Tax=Coemansia erecta TaxID=147472 RepID=A0A9W8CU65_9FUNG|nr:hypothetical protein LPJ53_002121 [Coemansia erecta]
MYHLSLNRSKNVNLTVELDTPTVYLYGERSCSAGCILSGTVQVSVQKTIRLKSLNVRFSGTQQIKYPHKYTATADYPLASTREITSDTQCLIAASRGKPAELKPGTHTLHFEFIVRGDLPPTTDFNFGSIAYNVRAELVYSGFRIKSAADAPVRILRCPAEGGLWASTTCDALSAGVRWDCCLAVRLTHSTIAVSDGQTSKFTVIVAALEKGMRLRNLDLQLREIQALVVDGGTTKFKHSLVVAYKHKMFGMQGARLTGQDEFAVDLVIPRAFGAIQYDCEGAGFMITHRLTLTAEVSISGTQNVMVTLPVQLSVLPHPSFAK